MDNALYKCMENLIYVLKDFLMPQEARGQFALLNKYCRQPKIKVVVKSKY